METGSQRRTSHLLWIFCSFFCLWHSGGGRGTDALSGGTDVSDQSDLGRPAGLPWHHSGCCFLSGDGFSSIRHQYAVFSDVLCAVPENKAKRKADSPLYYGLRCDGRNIRRQRGAPGRVKSLVFLRPDERGSAGLGAGNAGGRRVGKISSRQG